MRRWPAFLAALVPVLAAGPAAASECDDPSPDWLMCEDFEGGDQGWEAWFANSSFTECNGCPDGVPDAGRIQLVDDEARDGEWSLHMPGAASADYRGASLTYRSCQGEKRPGCTLTGYDQLYYRAWVKLASDHRYVHHFMSIAGTQPDQYWGADGNAGCRPNGRRAAGTTVDFNRDHELFFYTYFPEMNCDSGGYCSGDYVQNICDGCADKNMACDDGPECCWGNHFSADPRPVLPKGQWVCLEMMQRLNTPGEADGEMAFWVDGELGHRQTGMHWRDVAELQLNKVWVQHYIASGDTDQSNRIWWDDVVVSTERIGCEAAQPGDPSNSRTNNGSGPNGPGSNSQTGSDDQNGSDDGSPGESLSTGDSEEVESDGAGGENVDATGGCGCSAGGAGGTLLTLLFAGLLGIRRRLLG